MNMFPINFPLLFAEGKPTAHCTQRRGIYCWVNLKNGKRYVGMAAGFGGFRERLLSEVRIDKQTGTPLLQLALRKYGIENFIAVELAAMDAEDAKTFGSYEQVFIHAFRSQAPNGYNITSGGPGTLNHSSISASIKKRGIKRPDISQMRAKRAELLSPDGVVHYIKNISAFAVSLGFPQSSFYGIASGRTSSYKGWRSNTITRCEYAKKLSGTAYFSSPDGEVVCVKNTKRFAAANGLSQGALNGVWLQRKHYNSCKGWIRATDEQIAAFDQTNQRTWEFDKWQ